MSIEYSSGRIDAAWLGAEPVGREDPWTCVSGEIGNQDYREAFLGNGYFGQRIGADGQDAAPVRGGRFVHGLWGQRDLLCPPAWAILRYNDGQASYGARVGTHRNYRQTLHMDRGLLITEDTFSSGKRTTCLQTQVFLSRRRKHVGVISVSLRTDFAGQVILEDALDGADVANGADWQSQPGETMTLSLKLGPHGRRLSLASRLIVGESSPNGCHCDSQPEMLTSRRASRANALDAATAQAKDAVGVSTATPVFQCGCRGGALRQHVDYAPTERGIVRRLSFNAEPGKVYTLCKLVALVHDGDCPDPLSAARTIVEQAAAEHAALLDEHAQDWQALWRGRIEVPDLHLQKILNAALYQIYSSLREDVHWSVGPCGLSGGAYGGRVFWDADLWIFPAIAPLAPHLARSIVEYRVRTLPAARQNAVLDGCQGALFAWESAETGAEVVADEYADIHHQRHINSDVAYAQWKYYLITGDQAYLRDKALDVILESAAYWASRVSYNPRHDRYELLGIHCADEAAGIRDNNVFTNYSAVWTLQLASRLAKRFDRPVPPVWDQIIRQMYYPFDAERRLFLEYDGYNDCTIKQVDTALVIYPYDMPMDDDVRANTVDLYRSKYPPPPGGTVMMSVAMDGVVHAQLGRRELAWQALLDLLPHFRMPYFLVSERPWNEFISFHTGLGGLLQLVINGFAGVRFEEDGLKVAPCLPPDWQGMTIRGLHYGGESFDLEITEQGSRAELTNASGPVNFIHGRR